MTFLDEMQPYCDLYGLYHNKPQDRLQESKTISQSALTCSAEAALIAWENGDKGVLAEHLAPIAFNCLSHCNAVLYRHPRYHHEGNQLSIDCVAGYAAISKLSGRPEIAETLLTVWKAKCYSFWCTTYSPDELQYRTYFSHRAWMGRYAACIAALEWAAGRTPPLWRRTYFGACLRWDSIATPDRARLARLQAACSPDSYWLRLTNARIAKYYGSVAGMYQRYFDDGGTHPFGRWA